METKRTSVYENGLIWFGAGVSIAEILTGTYLAPLGFQRGLAAVIIGHIIGCCMMFFAGLIGARMRKSAMETVKMSFGQKGGLLFAVLNVLQLVGWTAIMIYDGALAADGIFHNGAWVWCIVIGALIVLWIAVGVTNLGKINTIAMAALFILTILLCRVIFFGGSDAGADLSSDAMSFGAAVELSVAMPLSWLPVISDYTREAEKPVKATAASVIVYGLVSCWMYVIGMGAAIYTGETDIAIIMAKAGLGDNYMSWLDVWRRNLELGMTTWGETSDVERTRSDCHAWGASPNIEFFRTILGIDSAAPGFKEIVIAPRLGGIKEIGGSMPHPDGAIEVHYRNGRRLKAEITLPEGTCGHFVWKGHSVGLHEGTNNLTL